MTLLMRMQFVMRCHMHCICSAETVKHCYRQAMDLRSHNCFKPALCLHTCCLWTQSYEVQQSGWGKVVALHAAARQNGFSQKSRDRHPMCPATA